MVDFELWAQTDELRLHELETAFAITQISLNVSKTHLFFFYSFTMVTIGVVGDGGDFLDDQRVYFDKFLLIAMKQFGHVILANNINTNQTDTKMENHVLAGIFLKRFYQLNIIYYPNHVIHSTTRTQTVCPHLRRSIRLPPTKPGRR